jgi:hypothetical protein
VSGLFALMVPDDVLLIVCQGIEKGTWEWWLKGCWIFESSPFAAPVALGVTMAAVAGVQLWARGRG